MGHTIIVTHTDLDGVGSAAAYIRIARLEEDSYTIIFAEPYNLDKTLEELVGNLTRGDTLVIADLGVNRDTYEAILDSLKTIISDGVRVEWYDHHIWPPDEVNNLKSIGVNLFIDRSTCATGVVVRYASKIREVSIDDYLDELEAAVCAADLWKWDHPLAPKLFRVVGERGEEEWKASLARRLAKGPLWDEDLSQKLEEYVNLELRGYDKVLRTIYIADREGCRVAAAFKENGPPSNSFIGALLLSRYQSDIAVIVRPNGALSLRSRSVDVQAIARELGGGGHPRAAGAKVSIPRHVRLLGLLSKKMVSRFFARLIARVAVSGGYCG
jgi:oligoribonuclease NrnB/cAMP/cGMP phosphodiesterase (DHH superfamily)